VDARFLSHGPVIDIHVHLARRHFPAEGTPQAVTLTVEQLISRMDREGIDIAVLLPLEGAEAFYEYYLTAEALADAARFPERLVAFCHLDPRQMNYFPERVVLARLERMAQAGARGFGEHKVGLPVDHPWSLACYRLAGELGLPVLLHLDFTLNTDENGQPGLERVLRECPRTVFIGHGPTFWAEVSADFDRASRVTYPTGPVKPGGSTDRLLADYPNLYADLSAYSAYNALTRDPDWTADFIARHWRKLLLGTDYLQPRQDLPILRWVREFPLSDEQRTAICGGTAARLLRLG
jgi:predicted TIM-barrel fold metal-dependent hydrolase